MTTDENRTRTDVPSHAGSTHGASVVQFDLSVELTGLRRGQQYENGAPSGHTLLKAPDLRIVLLALKAGGRMEEHSASGPCSIHVIAGSLRVHVNEGEFDLGPGGLLTIGSAVRHDVEAREDSSFLLTIGRTTYEHVSDSHEPHN